VSLRFAAIAGTAVLCAVVGAARALLDDDPLSVQTGGATTVEATGRNAFSFPAANLPEAERTRFVVGNSFFRRNWVEAPSSTGARDGLGPHFIARSCGGCHVQDGRGEPPNLRKRLHDAPVALLLRVSVPGTDAHGGPKPEPNYGDQITNAAVRGTAPEAEVRMRERPLRVRFADGATHTLHAPSYALARLSKGPLAPGAMLSPRIAPQLAGVGLIESIADADIERNAREQATQPGPIKGVPNRVWDAFAGEMRIGRYGWKANVASLAHQTAAAFAGDIGIASSLFGDGTGGAPEIDDRIFDDVVFYQATLAPAARRNADDVQVRRGERAFHAAQCAACHRPSYVTAAGPFPRLTSGALQGQRIHPYTDLLLHDMGDGLADSRPDFAANGRQWKTPPLWGIGLIRDVNGHQRLLHDGRARGVLDAVLWHGGEAQASRDAVLQMSKAERDALVMFVESL
jgi:CxxC motif-containing protein (DUF1111 family)